MPGCVRLFVLEIKKMSAYASLAGSGWNILIFVMTGFLAGIAVSELMQIFLKRLQNTGQFRKLCTDINITYKSIAEALKKAGMIKNVSEVSDLETAEKYMIRIYNDIQVDKKYQRIHNYASAMLLCKNMFFVSMVCACKGIFQRSVVLCLIGVMTVFLFFHRWKRFEKKKKAYTLCWFLDKYTN